MQVEIPSSYKRRHYIRHGMFGTRFYHTWANMLSRCETSTDRTFKFYGARGIRVEWSNFPEFKKDMYASYKRHIKLYGKKETTIDRRNSKGNYSKTNCRWATLKTQQRNKSLPSHSRFLTHNGKTMTVSSWCRKLKVDRTTIDKRINKSGWSIKKALSTPVKQYNRARR